MSQSVHTPVLLNEVLSQLAPATGKTYIDATVGAGGHTKELLSRGAKVLGLDQDIEILKLTQKNLANPLLTLTEANFMTIRTQADKYGFNPVDGILFDLGVSSLQLDTPDRGFSFQHDAPLDMRMSRKRDTTAADIVNTLSEDELFALLVQNAQEPKARAIAHALATKRPITTTKQLADIVARANGGRTGAIHPATRTFQALRIAVNQELTILRPALEEAFSLLKPHGRLAVISFHEGEDRIVKRSFEKWHEVRQALLLTKNPVIPIRDEIIKNPRSRSAKLRVIEKL